MAAVDFCVSGVLQLDPLILGEGVLTPEVLLSYRKTGQPALKKKQKQTCWGIEKDYISCEIQA